MNATALPALSSLDELIAAGDWTATRAALDEAIRVEPDRAEWHQLLGHCHLNLGDPAAAATAYARSVTLAPRDPAGHACFALSLQLSGNFEPAAEAARYALELAPGEPIAMKVLARLALDAGRRAEAETWCDRILAEVPGDPDATTLRAAARAPMLQPGTANDLAQASDEEIRLRLVALHDRVGFRRLQRLGFHLQRNDYYSPLNDCAFFEANPDLWNKPPLEPAGINWRRAEQLEQAREISPFLTELRDVPAQPPADGSAYGWKNNFWENADALAHYGIVRARRPRRYIEIGCRWSSLLLKRALAANAAEGAPCEVTLIEPYPNPTLFRHFPSAWTIHRQMIQRVDLALYAELEAGDVLFYDGSHCAKVASDVNWFFFRVLPVLKPGVIIHLHDISLPMEYPHPWIFERGQTWNEQYVLQAFLMHNADYAVMLANRYLYVHHPEELGALYHGLQPVHGSSFWMQKIA